MSIALLGSAGGRLNAMMSYRERSSIIATAYVAPTLFSVGQAQAWDNHTDRHGSYSRHKYSKHSYSRASYSQLSGNEYRGRERDRLREYRKDPVLILEDVILGPPRR